MIFLLVVWFGSVKNYHKGNQDAHLFLFSDFVRLGKLFCRFVFKVGKPGHQETFENYTLFSFVATSANLPITPHMIHFNGQLSLQLKIKFEWILTQQ